MPLGLAIRMIRKIYFAVQPDFDLHQALGSEYTDKLNDDLVEITKHIISNLRMTKKPVTYESVKKKLGLLSKVENLHPTPATNIA